MMAVDYIVGSLLFSSAAVNILALGAFWISPGLRTTANRFVINLLVINVIGCLTMTPALWLNGGLKSKWDGFYHSETSLLTSLNDAEVPNRHSSQIRQVHDEPNELNYRYQHHRSSHHYPNSKPIHHFDTSRIEEEIIKTTNVLKSIESFMIERESNNFGRRLSDNDEPLEQTLDCTRFWGFDLAAALGGLSVVLVVGDTWCAVTDPLRYHSRISYMKSWILIACVWFIGITFGIASAFRNKCNLIIDVNDLMLPIDIDIYSLVYSCIYFILMILLPISLVCIMYWKIYSEAKQSGMRMRRNGSSPLLQSALNLAHGPMNTNGSFTEHNRSPSLMDINASDVLTMKIDGKHTDDIVKEHNDFNRNLVKMNVPIGTHQYRRYLDIPKTMPEDGKECSKLEKNPKAKLSQFKRNCSSRQLFALEEGEVYPLPTPTTRNNNLSRMITGEMRQVHSSPNLQKLSNLDLLNKAYCSTNRSTNNIDHQQHQHHQHSTTSPKALSYMISIRHRLSNASSIFKYREESRAARISILVVVMLMVSYFPFGILVLLQGRVTFIANSSLLSILFLLISNMTSPFIFAYRNRRVRRGVCRLFGVDAKPNLYLQKQRMQLRNGMHSQSGSGKHVRIHRNLSASNYSLNLLPYKFGSSTIIPLHHLPNEQFHNTLSKSNGGNGSVLVPIHDDIENNEQFISEKCEAKTDVKNSMELIDGPKDDVNNNANANTNVNATNEKMTFFQRVYQSARKPSMPSITNVTKENEPVNV